MQRLLELCVRPIRYAFAHPWRTLGGACALLMLGTLGLYKWVEYCSYCELRAAIAETDALFPRWRLEEIEADRPHVPDEENSALLIERVAALMDQAERQSSVKLADEILQIDESGHKALNEHLDDQALQKLQRALQMYGPAVDAAVRLKDFPRGRWPLKLEADGYSTVLPHLSSVRRVANIVFADAQASMHESESQRVTDILVAACNLGYSLSGDSTISSIMVHEAMIVNVISALEEGLAHLSFTGEDLFRMESEMAKSLESLNPPAMVAYERGVAHEYFSNWQQSRIGGAGLIGSQLFNAPASNWSPYIFEFLYRPMIPADHAFCLRMMNQGVLMAAEPEWHQRRLWSEWEREAHENVKHGPLVYRNLASGELLVFATHLGKRNVSARVSVSLGRAAIAIERFRLAEQRWPMSIAELVPRYAPQPIIDPFDGQPLRLARRADGITVYSVSENQIDDGGTIAADARGTPVHMLSPIFADQCFRLWDPEHRGLPAKPHPSAAMP